MFQRLLVVLALVLVARELPAQDLQLLRDASANRFFDPATHLALAKYHHDRGNRLLAFFLSEKQRRSVEPAIFNWEFGKIFVDQEPFDNSAAAEAKLRDQVAANPGDAQVLVQLADIYISRSDWPNATARLREALRLSPEDFSIRQALGAVLRRQDEGQAADQLIDEFLTAYPDSADAFESRVDQLMQNEPEKARLVLIQGLQRYPDNANMLFNLGVVQQSADDDEGALKSLTRAADLGKNSAHIQGWVGRYFLKVVGDPARALDYYLNAYFLDPDFYDSEYAESRIRSIAWDLAAVRLNELIREGEKGWLAALKHDNPVIVSRALRQLDQEPWQAKLLEAVVELMAHDDVTVRWEATQLLLKKAAEDLRPRLPQLLTSPDLRSRGLAAYLAVPLLGRESFPVMRQFLASECELLRYDAMSALIIAGDDESRAVLAEHKKTETQPKLLKILESRNI